MLLFYRAMIRVVRSWKAVPARTSIHRHASNKAQPHPRACVRDRRGMRLRPLGRCRRRSDGSRSADVWGERRSMPSAPRDDQRLRIAGQDSPGPHDTKASYHDASGLQIEDPDVKQCETTAPTLAAHQAAAPWRQDPSQLPAFDMTLEEAIHTAVEQSPVLRSIGGTVVTAPRARGPSLIRDRPCQPDTGYRAALVSALSCSIHTTIVLVHDRATQQRCLGWFHCGVHAVGFLGDQCPPSPMTSSKRHKCENFQLHVVNYSRTNQPFRAFSSAFTGWVEADGVNR